MTFIQKRASGLGALLLFCAAVVSACSDSTASDALADKSAPTVNLISPTASALRSLPDTTLSFSVQIKDNLGIKSVHVALTGGHVARFDTTFTSAVTDIVLPLEFITSRSVPPGTPVTVVATATDGAGNRSVPDTIRLTVGNVPPAVVRITSPASGTVAVVGKSLIVSISGRTIVKVRSLGFTTTGAHVSTDSVLFASPLRDSVSVIDTLSIPATVLPGTITVTPFVVDSLGQKTTGSPISITVQVAAAVNSVPVVTFSLNARSEVRDTIHVEATDQTGIVALGYEVRRVQGGATESSDSVISNGVLTSQVATFRMRLPYTVFPTTVFVQAFARNSNGVRTYAKRGGIDRVDTVLVVAGTTRGLPLGGVVADALYHTGTDRLYLTNILRNTVEVFSLADSSFKAPIIVGSRPWGIAPWPANRSGAMDNRLLVANSGGTDISIVDVSSGSGREINRYALPNIVAFSITTVLSATSAAPIQQRTKYDFSDRPQFLAATCTENAGGACGDVFVVYSTTPTAGQPEPFNVKNGTLRWENITRGTSHLFFEQAIGQGEARADTLEILREDGNTGVTTSLLKYRDTVSSATSSKVISTVVNLPLLAFRDTTFVRNSGDFRRAIIGEGGSVKGSRALTYDVNAGRNTPIVMPDGSIGFQTSIDRGVSPATNVSDFIGNTFSSVQGVAMNFDGSLAAIRGDSTYILNNSLRLRGILATTAGNAGIDFHPRNTGPTSFPLSARLAFAASSEPVIEVYDTNCYQRVTTVPIRDPIVGPIKAALRPFSGQLVLIGATARGVVIVTLDNTFTTSCP